MKQKRKDKKLLLHRMRRTKIRAGVFTIAPVLFFYAPEFSFFYINLAV